MDYKCLNSFKDKYENKIFRYWVYKKNTDTNTNGNLILSPYESDLCFYGIIEEIFSLPNGDVLIAFQDPDADFKCLNYYKLSEIRLQYNSNDNEEQYE